MNILLVSNGLGEDLIAVNLIKAIKKITPAVKIQVLPLVGEGLAYQKIKLSPLLKNKILPSGGFIKNIGILINDLKHGLLKQFFQQIKTIKKIAKHTDIIICVGDVYCLFLGSFINKSQKYFLATAKSNTFTQHSKLECLLIKKWAESCYTRDKLTAAALQKEGVKAKFLGNPMFDNIVSTKNSFNFAKNAEVLGLVPGSREEAYQNLVYLLKVVDKILEKKSDIKLVLAKADTLQYSKIKITLKNTKWGLVKKSKKYILFNKNLAKEIIITTEYAQVLGTAKLILGLAGTANEQAIFSGLKVICFEGFGTQASKKRFLEQEKLLGKNLIFIKKRNLKTIVKKIFAELKIKKNDKKKPVLQNASEKIIKNIFQGNILA